MFAEKQTSGRVPQIKNLSGSLLHKSPKQHKKAKALSGAVGSAVRQDIPSRKREGGAQRDTLPAAVAAIVLATA